MSQPLAQPSSSGSRPARISVCATSTADSSRFLAVSGAMPGRMTTDLWATRGLTYSWVEKTQAS